VRNNVTKDEVSQSFTAEGNMTLFHVGKYADVPSGYGNVMRDGYQGTTTPYKIEGGKVVTFLSQDPYSFTFYKLGSTYYAARSNEFGYANYEIIPPPQITLNPLTELSSQFSTELGLTAQQRQQILPILKDEMTQLQGLKKSASSLSGVQKVEELRKLGAAFDEKISPLLNPDQQKKFQALREEARRRLIEQMAREATQKLESDVHWKG
jgi:hypothetical protein